MTISDRNRQIFEGAGLDAIKLDVAFGGTRFNLASADVAAQAKEWLAETETKLQIERESAASLERRRYLTMLRWTIVAAIAGTAAAIASIFTLLK